MVSLYRSSLTLLSFSRPTIALLNHFKPFASRKTCFATAGLVATLSLPTAFATTTCDSTTRRNMTSNSDSLMTGYLNSEDAAALDVELMSQPGFSLEQLMELAGLAVAETVYQVVPSSPSKKARILLICGPGNNGGDGLVAARHLFFFGYDCVVLYPKRSSKTHFVNLVKQCEDVGIPLLDEWPQDGEFDAIVDAIFGFSFKGAPREPFKLTLEQMQDAQSSKDIPVISVDVPSGWDVDEGDVAGTGFLPQVLVSLTTPKESAHGFKGRHFVGGRFLPPKLAEKYNVSMPPYPGVSQVMEVTNLSASEKGESFSDVGWEAEYAAYLAEKLANESGTDSPSPSVPEHEKVEEESWEAQYAAHCAGMEARLANEDAKYIQEMKEAKNL
jgi:NAD(P)H-hydrate epimerase